MPPIRVSPISVRVDNSSSSSSSSLELTLITLALLSSLVLSLLPSPRVHSSPSRRAVSATVKLVAVFFGSLAIVLGLIALILGWRRVISFDALTGVIFGLIPALISLPPRNLFLHWYYIRLMRTRRSLNVKPHDFRYIRYGRRCGDDPDATRWASTFGGQCRGSECRVSMFIRIMPAARAASRYSDPFAAAFEADDAAPRSASGQVQTIQRYGTRIGHTQHFVVLRDRDYGMTAWWWAALSSGTRLVADPSLIHLNSKDRVLNALALLADIVSISSMLQRYDVFLATQLKSDRAIRSAISGMEGIVCNLILEELKLDNWGRIGPDMLLEDYVYRRLHRKKVLFLFLSHHSNVFGPPLSETAGGMNGQRVSAQQIMDRIMESGRISVQDFSELCKHLIETWLQDWGCPQQKLLDFNTTNKPDIVVHPTARHSWEGATIATSAAAQDRDQGPGA